MELAIASSSSSSYSFPSLCPSSLSFSASKSSFFVSSNTGNLLFKSASCSTNRLISSSRSRPGNRPQRRGLSCTCVFGLGVPELVVIAGVTALVFGPKQLPEVGRSLGKTIKNFQQAAKEFESELKKESDPDADGTESKPTSVGADVKDAEVSASKDSS